jgi:quinoprotein glucose dehydrogenase
MFAPDLRFTLSTAGVGCLLLVAAGLAQTPQRDWRAYGGNAEGTRYSPLRQITKANVDRLQVVWQFDPNEGPPAGRFQAQPILVDGVVYTPTPGGFSVIALDGASGRLKWSWNSGVRTAVRGVTYWADRNQKRLLAAFGRYVYALDPETGQPFTTFGREGRIDLHQDLGRDPDRQSVSLTTPGIIYQNLYIVGGRTSEGLPASLGDIRAYDVLTGALRWSFHTIPRPGEVGYETWPKDAWTYTGSANNWAGMALDTRRGIVYVPTGSAASDFYGANRVGDNLFANTLLALNAKTGERLWHFQAVKHDIWDRDFPSPPTLVTVRRDGKTIDAVAQTTKHGAVFLFDRVTGSPLFPIAYRPVPASTVEGEVTSSTQPFSVKPEPFARQLLTEDLLTNRTPEVHQWALEQFRKFRTGGQFMPFAVGTETVVFPGFDGGAEWGGSAYDPVTGVIYVNANDVAWTSSMRRNTPTADLGRQTYVSECSSCHGDNMAGGSGFPSLVDIASRRLPEQITDIVRTGAGRMPGFSSLTPQATAAVVRYVLSGEAKKTVTNAAAPTELLYNFTGYHKWLDPDGYPAVAPPWGTLNAINLNTGEYAWKIPLGEYPALAAQGLKDTGTENYGGPIVTAGGIVFIGATNFDKKFRAFDKDTGKLLWEAVLPNSGNTTPISYEINGKQYVLIAAFGGYGNRPPGGAASGRGQGAPPEVARVGAGGSSGGAFVAFALSERK